MKSLTGVQAYPLSWPLGWKRTQVRRTAPYKLTLERALQELTSELRLFRAKDFVVSTNIQPRLAGLPRGGGGDPADVGVAVYWEDRSGQPRVMACDAWNTVRGNVRAIAITISALRQIERSGASQLLERAFTGFAALPAQAGESSWRATLGLNGGPVTRDDVEAAYKRAARVAHPDLGGSHDRMVEVNGAYHAALRELSRSTQ